jgi:hypothetical protein
MLQRSRDLLSHEPQELIRARCEARRVEVHLLLPQGQELPWVLSVQERARVADSADVVRSQEIRERQSRAHDASASGASR